MNFLLRGRHLSGLIYGAVMLLLVHVIGTLVVVSPHVVNFMDQMLRSDEDLRVEEVMVPIDFATTALGNLIRKSRDHILLATHAHGRRMFNPADDEVVKRGTALVLMASPKGRALLEKLLKGGDRPGGVAMIRALLDVALMPQQRQGVHQ